jgi:ribosome-associated protein
VEREVQIRGDTIRLGQLLKLAGVASSGGDARELLSSGDVLVNGELEERRGRQLHPGDTVTIGDLSLRVSA